MSVISTPVAEDAWPLCVERCAVRCDAGPGWHTFVAALVARFNRSVIADRVSGPPPAAGKGSARRRIDAYEPPTDLNCRGRPDGHGSILATFAMKANTGAALQRHIGDL